MRHGVQLPLLQTLELSVRHLPDKSLITSSFQKMPLFFIFMTDFDKIWLNFDEIGPNLTNFQNFMTKFDQIWTNLTKLWIFWKIKKYGPPSWHQCGPEAWFLIFLSKFSKKKSCFLIFFMEFFFNARRKLQFFHYIFF